MSRPDYKFNTYEYALINRSGINRLYSVTLGDLIESGIFKWVRYETTERIPLNLDWSDAAYNEETFKRLCSAFEERYYFDEISITPPLKWMNMLAYKIRHELAPKYNKLYKLFDDYKVNPLYDSDEYGKSRKIGSEYPETLLSGNSDYASGGNDEEYEKIKIGNVLEQIKAFKSYKDIDAMFIDDLKSMFYLVYSEAYDFNDMPKPINWNCY